MSDVRNLTTLHAGGLDLIIVCYYEERNSVYEEEEIHCL